MKLSILRGYLNAYTIALKNQPFRKAYIDAFAGSGYRAPRKTSSGHEDQALLLPEMASGEAESLRSGSARIALETDPPFDRYIFVERSRQRCESLETLKVDFPELAGDIRIEQGEANEAIQGLCRKDWSSHRAVLFLDPYGLQVEWKTIEAVAET